jgi:cytochrome b subunit of formate dehydrogenase
MHVTRVAACAMTCLFSLAAALGMWHAPAEAADAPAAKDSAQAPEKPDNATCLACHGIQGFSAPDASGQTRSLHVVKDKFEKSVHGKRQCVECHKDITEIPHQKGVQHRVGCVQCHQDLWEAAQSEKKTQENARLGVVVKQIDRYMKSIHARPSKEDQSRTNATCYNCHDAHYVYPPGSPERAEWRLGIPNVCGKCHGKERDEYVTSVHGREAMEKGNPKAAVCSDCHTTHDIEDPFADTTRLVITKNCGNCHAENLKTYAATYHGQVNLLGYAHTAKCFDCHGNHSIQRVNDPRSMVHPDNRLKTCGQCHMGVTKGFATFEPHGTTTDLRRFPQIWLASKFMLGLLAGTFAFFWTHTALWFYREYKERRARGAGPHIRAEQAVQERTKYYQRFPPVWRLAHLVFALSLMILALTGMSVFYADTGWAPVIMKELGGPRNAAFVHRVFAVIFATIFMAQLVYFLVRIGRNWTTFDWFGPNSLIPRWQDLWDIVAMFKWFVGLGPRPVFDRWTYWEKFDYWAPFWGVTIIGVSGAMLWFPTVIASFLPGWVFNVATIFHGEEALLAILFLFTVHFFNNHFRPDKFPLDIVMFTGAVPLEVFKEEHTVEYNRLVETRQLANYLVDPPSPGLTLASKILGFCLIAFGLTLLTLVLIGILSGGSG